MGETETCQFMISLFSDVSRDPQTNIIYLLGHPDTSNNSRTARFIVENINFINRRMLKIDNVGKQVEKTGAENL